MHSSIGRDEHTPTKDDDIVTDVDKEIPVLGI